MPTDDVTGHNLMNEASRFLAQQVLRQIEFVSHQGTRDGALDAAVVNAYFYTLRSLRGGEVVAIPPSIEEGSHLSGVYIFEHTDNYAAFLTILGIELRREGARDLASRVFALNKMLHALNIWVDVEMPPHFRLVHCVGTVIGRAELGDYLYVDHGCTIGASSGRVYPTLGNSVSLRSGSAVLGRCLVGNNVVISAGVTLINRDVPDNSIVLQGEGQPQIVPSTYPDRFSRHVFGR